MELALNNGIELSNLSSTCIACDVQSATVIKDLADWVYTGVLLQAPPVALGLHYA